METQFRIGEKVNTDPQRRGRGRDRGQAAEPEGCLGITAEQGWVRGSAPGEWEPHLCTCVTMSTQAAQL